MIGNGRNTTAIMNTTTSPIGTISPTQKQMINSNNNNNIVSTCDNNNNNRYPPNHPLSGSKHLCAICEDRASGKHYGVYRLVEPNE